MPDSAPLEDTATAEVAASPANVAPRRRRRWLAPLLILAGVTALLWMPLVEPQRRQMMVQWHALAARQALLAEDLDAALGSAEKSIEWAAASLPEGDLAAALAKPEDALIHSPKLATALRARAEVRQARHELEASLADYNALIAVNPHVAQSYLGRANVLLRLGRGREAVDDTSQAVNLRMDGDPIALNARAYTRAVANLELDEALLDAERALNGLDQPDAAILDTRAYVLLLLERADEALPDMDRAIELAEQAIAQQNEKQPSALESQAGQHALAVMYHHRGLIHEKLGNSEQAAADLQRGQELGYDPEKGVF